jgi:hypothetical protein
VGVSQKLPIQPFSAVPLEKQFKGDVIEQRNGYDRRARMPVTPLTNNDQPQFLLYRRMAG